MPRILRLTAALGLGFCLLGTPHVTRAANTLWTGGSSSNWLTAGNWNPAVVPVATDMASFNNNGNGHTIISLGAGAGISNLLFDTASAAAYTIGSLPAGSQTLNMNGSGVFNVTSAVTNTETFNAMLTLSTANGDRPLGFTNNCTTPGQSLILAGGM